MSYFRGGRGGAGQQSSVTVLTFGEKNYFDGTTNFIQWTVHVQWGSVFNQIYSGEKKTKMLFYSDY